MSTSGPSLLAAGVKWPEFFELNLACSPGLMPFLGDGRSGSAAAEAAGVGVRPKKPWSVFCVFEPVEPVFFKLGVEAVVPAGVLAIAKFTLSMLRGLHSNSTVAVTVKWHCTEALAKLDRW